MSLKEHYNQLYKESITKISSDTYEIDPMLNSDSDDRFGLSLVIRPPIAVKNEIKKFLKELEGIEPNQYYYPNSDIHITVISVISCYSGLKLSDISLPEYIELIDRSFKNIGDFTIRFEGITASPSCIMIQGFIHDSSLNRVRDELRKNFKTSNLEQSMDERYLIQTAHATVFRFREKLEQKETFLKLIAKYRDYNFGMFEVDTIELVYNDWYHRENLVTNLYRFTI